MQTSILWEGSLPSKEEMEKMKQEGYLFCAGEGGWKICLKLHNTPTGTWYADNFSKSFLKEVELHQYLEEVEKRATWFEVPSKELRVYEAGQILEKPESKEERICMEVLRDTKNHSRLLLKTNQTEAYQLGSSAIPTLESRARISGAALSSVEPAVLAEILNQCLKVAKGKALLRVSEGKVRAVHSAEKNGYQVYPLPEVFMLASVYIRGEYKKSTFLEGYADQTMVSAIWQIEDHRLEEVYGEIMEKYGKQVKEKLTATIRITSSDVAASGANIFYSLMEGQRKIALGTDMRMRHNNSVEFQQFTENLLSTFECYKNALKGTVEKLCAISIEYPVNTMIGIMTKQGFGKKNVAEIVDRFKATFGDAPCTAYEVYCGIGEILFLAQSKGISGRTMVELEEKVAKCTSMKWREYDIPGDLVY